ncbi:hypothetical protein LQG66_36850 [Bradyrhizobium ontarionense]|uniref:Uncharacterized protein n=1 Tax=Bradyrhizobium ontarionense TaxID=2898149 RepID=A0ABY3RBX0_9BRAD|nr:hypothetical protein [Bradyrhizobium sp. A19]UFZ04686.1 hypothetical protein LQG66_36850 [Bradyrhizobium sp. A19]
MDRDTFLKLAPEYYMLALFIHFDYPRDLHGESSFARDFAVNDDSEWHDFVESAPLRQEALRRLERLGAIKLVLDAFGPILWHRGPNFERLLDEWEKTPSSVFYKARMSGDRREWLMAALPKVNGTAQDLKITSADYSAAAVSEFTSDSFAEAAHPEPADEWAPITLDQTDPVVTEATKQLGAATEAIEQDNGYSIKHPQERDAVVQDLKGGLDKLKSGVVSVGWMRRIVNGLRISSVRFADTIKGQTIDGTLMALREVVKSHMSHLIEHLFWWLH